MLFSKRVLLIILLNFLGQTEDSKLMIDLYDSYPRVQKCQEEHHLDFHEN